jgi:hypothetical protein
MIDGIWDVFCEDGELFLSREDCAEAIAACGTDYVQALDNLYALKKEVSTPL